VQVEAMKATWGPAALLVASLVGSGCRWSSSCGAVLSDYTAPSGARGCWQYTADFEGAVVGTPVTSCPTVNQLGLCEMTGDRAAACGEIFYTDNGLTADQARQDCLAAGGVWSP
jgi:hypothetical protein